MNRVLLLSAIVLLAAPADTPEKANPDRESLSRLQAFVGDWRGVGQPRRGSNKDAWSEECGWAWNFAESDVSLALHSENAKYFRSANLRPGREPDQFELTTKTAEGETAVYRGQLADGVLVLLAEKDRAELPSRITVRFVAGGDRMLVLYERKQDAERFTRMAEVGFTRKGSNFGKNTSYVECVVTGGTGTIQVTYEGKIYYVCCTGCRDYFNDNPAEVLAEYRAKKEAEKEKAGSDTNK